MKRDKSNAVGRLSEDAVYSAVASRQMHYDNLAWQVPILSLTAQAFLFSIALAPGSTAVARLIAATLSIVVAILSVLLLVRHRQADITDARWLAEFSRRRLGKKMVVHGKAWRDEREKTRIDKPGWIRAIPFINALGVWVAGLLVFAVADIVILVLTFGFPTLLTGTPMPAP